MRTTRGGALAPRAGGSRPYRDLVVALLSGAAAVSPRTAGAFCRTTTCTTCVQPQNGCISEGTPLVWPADCVSYDVQKDASRQVPLATAMAVADRAFQHWIQAGCGAGGASPSVKVLDRGPVSCGSAEYNDGVTRVGGNANMILFRDNQWDLSADSDPASTLALTTVTFNVNTGEIYDADIEVNTTEQVSTSTPVPSSSYDLESILTHEAGHFFGLAHSHAPCTADGCPTMHAYYQKGMYDFRTLKADDISGICSVYPANRVVQPSSCVPRGGFADVCGTPAKAGGGCSTAIEVPTAHADASGPLSVAVLAAAMLVRGRARKVSRPSPQSCDPPERRS